MARRKVRSSSQIHKSWGAYELRAAKRHAKAAGQYIKEGVCKGALHHLLNAVRAFGAADEDARSESDTPLGTRRPNLVASHKMLDGLRQAFAKRCVR